MTQVGVETSLSVEVVNTLVTTVAAVLILFLAPGLQKWLSRRHWNTVSNGKTTDLLVSEGFDGFKEFLFKVRKAPAGGGERGRAVRDLLPYVLVIVGLNLLPYSTSGVGVVANEKDGSPVKVIGSLANPDGNPIDILDTDTLSALRNGEINDDAAPFLLGSPELLNFGTNVTGLEWGVTFPGDGLSISGDGYTVEQNGPGQGTYPVSTCLTVTEADGVYSADACVDVRIELETTEFVVESVQSVEWTLDSCEVEEHSVSVFNQGVTYRRRDLTLESFDMFTEEEMVVGTEVTAVCGEIYESIIEACLFEVGGHVYVGDWNAGDYTDPCGEDIPSMYVVEMDASSGMFPSSDEYIVAVSMLAEIVAGSGAIKSRQQLALILGVFSRMSAMKLGAGTAYTPETVVMVTISQVVLVLWALLFAAGCALHIRERRLESKVFIPSSAWDWYAVGARASLGDGGASASTPPSAHHYLAKFGCQQTLEESDGVVQPLGWLGSGGQQEKEAVMGEGDVRPIPPSPPLGSSQDLENGIGCVEASRSAPRSVSPPKRRLAQV